MQITDDAEAVLWTDKDGDTHLQLLIDGVVESSTEVEEDDFEPLTRKSTGLTIAREA